MSDPLLKKKKIKSKIKNKIRELSFLKDSKEDFEELFSLYETELNKIISELSNCGIKEDTNPEKNDNSENIKIDDRSSYREDGILDAGNKIPEETPDWAKKLYKKIAIETHPDRFSNLEIDENDKKNREEIFKKSGELIRSGKFEELVYFANELNIDFEIEDENYLVIVENSINNLKSEFESKKTLVPWIWGNLEDNLDKKAEFIIFVREQLGENKIDKEDIKSFIFHYEKGSLEKWKAENKKVPSNRKHPGKSIRQKRNEIKN